MLKFDIKNRLKFENHRNSSKSKDEAKDPENSLKTEMIASILKSGKKTNEEHDPVTFVDIDSVLIAPKKASSVTDKTKVVVEKPQVKIVE